MFLMKMTESSLDLALSVLYGIIIPIQRLDFPNDKEVMCLHYHLQMEVLSLNVKTLGSE